MSIAALIRSACAPFRRFGADQDAAAAVEFALILPAMLALYIGGVTMTDALSVDRKVIVASHTVADLTAREAGVDNTQIGKILDAATAVMVPYPADKLTVTVTSLAIEPSGKVKTLWRATRTKGKTVITEDPSGDVSGEIPADLKTPNPNEETGLVWSEASYTYEPAIGYVITGKINLSERTFMRPRRGGVVDKE